MSKKFNWSRYAAVAMKEFIQMRRDKLTFGMLVMIPLMQLILFGYAINTTPRHLPTAVVSADNTAVTRAIVRGIANTKYFQLLNNTISERQSEQWLAQGRATFVVHIPPHFTSQLIRGKKPQLLLEADGTDPVASASAIGASQVLNAQVLNALLVGPLSHLKPTAAPFQIIVHAKYNPAQITQYNIVPGLLGVVLTMTMVMITSLSLTREREKGTMENLLATPVRPLEVMMGKIVPYIVMGYLQVILILIFSYWLFNIPIKGSLLDLAIAIFPFIAANLSIGLTFSSVAKNQLQAMQMSFFFFLPSILLSGFMFPFKGMPVWAQYLGQILPLTHFLHIVRGILLKGNGWHYIWYDIWPILLFMMLIIIVGLKRFRRTLD